ncbi:hypothetical protein ACNKHR_00545 [Shigella flexneri]
MYLGGGVGLHLDQTTCSSFRVPGRRRWRVGAANETALPTPGFVSRSIRSKPSSMKAGAWPDPSFRQDSRMKATRWKMR